MTQAGHLFSQHTVAKNGIIIKALRASQFLLLYFWNDYSFILGSQMHNRFFKDQEPKKK